MAAMMLNDAPRRSTQLGVAIIVVILGLVLTVAATELRIDAHAERDTVISIEDVARALRGRGLDVTYTDRDVEHPLLGVAGSTVLVNGIKIDIYTYPTVARRVGDEQRWNEQIMGLTRDQKQDSEKLPHVVSVRNALLLVHTDDAPFVLSIANATGDLVI